MSRYPSAVCLQSIVLDPVQKSNHIRKYWGGEMYADAMKHAEELVHYHFGRYIYYSLTRIHYSTRNGIWN